MFVGKEKEKFIFWGGGGNNMEHVFFLQGGETVIKGSCNVNSLNCPGLYMFTHTHTHRNKLTMIAEPLE